MRLLLIRHGRTAANEAHLYCGSSDLPLSEEGRSELFALRARRNFEMDGWTRITSGMRRTNETLEILFEARPDRIDIDLREIDFGRFELHSHEQLQNDPDYLRWICYPSGKLAPPGGEAADAFRARVLAAARRLPANSLVVTHGGVIATLMAHWFPEEAKHRWEWQPAFGRGYEVMLDETVRSYRAI